MPASDEAVDGFDGTLLPCGVRLGVVDVAAGELFEGGGAEKFASVVRGHGTDACPWGAIRPAPSAEGDLRGIWQGFVVKAAKGRQRSRRETAEGQALVRL